MEMLGDDFKCISTVQWPVCYTGLILNLTDSLSKRLWCLDKKFQLRLPTGYGGKLSSDQCWQRLCLLLAKEGYPQWDDEAFVKQVQYVPVLNGKGIRAASAGQICETSQHLTKGKQRSNVIKNIYIKYYQYEVPE